MIEKLTYIIPARMGSSRFPGKPLVNLNGKPVLHWVYDNCTKSRYSSQVIIATDSSEIVDYCKKHSLECRLTGIHNCASNRVAEVAKKLETDWIVEVQGDEPLLWPEIIDNWLEKCVSINISPDLFISTAVIKGNNLDDPNYVKVIINDIGKLLWVSRSKIPSNSNGVYNDIYMRHTGFHLWKKSSIIKFANILPSKIEIAENTHATRIVENNLYAHGVILPDTQSIDTPQDLIKAEEILKNTIYKYE